MFYFKWTVFVYNICMYSVVQKLSIYKYSKSPARIYVQENSFCPYLKNFPAKFGVARTVELFQKFRPTTTIAGISNHSYRRIFLIFFSGFCFCFFK